MNDVDREIGQTILNWVESICEGRCCHINWEKCLNRVKNPLLALYRQKYVGEIRREVVGEIRTLIPEAKIQFLTKDRLEYQMGWCDGRNKLREEIKTLLQKIGGGERR